MTGNLVRRLGAAAAGPVTLAALAAAPAVAAPAPTQGAEGRSAAATQFFRFEFDRIDAWNLDEDQWLSNGDEISLRTWSPRGLEHIWPTTDASFKVSKGQTCITFGHTCDTAGSAFKRGLNGGGYHFKEYAVGEEVRFVLEEHDTVGMDLLAEARITVTGEQQVFAISPGGEGYDYTFYGRLVPVG
ncbi:hypothetical protein ACWGB8_16130 [Kitasatospora sp. NPDC054939]